LWLWLAVSRKVKTVLGFVLSDRSDASLERLMTEEVPPLFWETSSCSDAWGAYRRLLPEGLHMICDKGSGKTSIVEGLNTKWRQRQSGLVRKSCGVSWRILDDLFERFLILVYRHNQQCLATLQKNKETTREIHSHEF
jgi:IS1 family transposase